MQLIYNRDLDTLGVVTLHEVPIRLVVIHVEVLVLLIPVQSLIYNRKAPARTHPSRSLALAGRPLKKSKTKVLSGNLHLHLHLPLHNVKVTDFMNVFRL